MIYFFTKDKNIIESMGKTTECIFKSPSNISEIYAVYENRNKVKLILFDLINIKNQLIWIDLLGSLSKEIPTIVISKKNNKTAEAKCKSLGISFLSEPSIEDLLKMIEYQTNQYQNGKYSLIQKYQNIIVASELKKHGFVSILSVDTHEFHKVAVEYGVEAFVSLQEFFQKNLKSMQGKKNRYRSSDLILKESSHNNRYFIILSQPRSEHTVAAPNTMAKLARRLHGKLQRTLWRELFKKNGALPNYLDYIPMFSIGYATSLDNPCIDTNQIIDNLLKTSSKTAAIQKDIGMIRRQEFIQSIISEKNILTPYYQAVFDLKKLEINQVLEAKRTNSINPIEEQLYGFEALVRLNFENSAKKLKHFDVLYIDINSIRPDTLFFLAKSVNLSLELDQACLKQASKGFADLPGQLMVNILPRNFYQIKKFSSIFKPGSKVTLEVSESEAINSFEVLQNARSELIEQCNIAIDDFGKGYAGLDRILKINPDIIKLDRNLIENIHISPSKQAFVLGIVQAAKVSEALILAEGVELIDELKVLKKLEIDYVQGFLLHRPEAMESIRNNLTSKLPKAS